MSQNSPTALLKYSLSTVVNHAKSQNALVNDLEGGLNVESDCESDSTEVSHGTLGVKKEEEETRAVLITGSFAAYVLFPTSTSGRER